jgi:hypothetical protein
VQRNETLTRTVEYSSAGGARDSMYLTAEPNYKK